MGMRKIDMTDLRTILEPYGIGSIESFRVLTGGSENSNYEIGTEQGKYVLTICEQKSADETLNLAKLLDYLEEQGFETTRLVKTEDDRLLSTFAGKPVLVKSYIEGKIISDLSEQVLEAIGREMGRLHKIEAPAYLPQTISYGREYFHEVEGYAPGSAFGKWLQDIEAYIEPKVSLDLPKALIHSDLFFNNVIVSHFEEHVSIMDFEEACYYTRVFDIGMAIIGLCGEIGKINLEKVSALLRGYEQENDLKAEEKHALQAYTVYAAAAMAFWRHKHFNFTKPDPEMKDHYLVLAGLADYVRALPGLGVGF